MKFILVAFLLFPLTGAYADLTVYERLGLDASARPQEIEVALRERIKQIDLVIQALGAKHTRRKAAWNEIKASLERAMTLSEAATAMEKMNDLTAGLEKTSDQSWRKAVDILRQTSTQSSNGEEGTVEFLKRKLLEKMGVLVKEEETQLAEDLKLLQNEIEFRSPGNPMARVNEIAARMNDLTNDLELQSERSRAAATEIMTASRNDFGREAEKSRAAALAMTPNALESARLGSRLSTAFLVFNEMNMDLRLRTLRFGFSSQNAGNAIRPGLKMEMLAAAGSALGLTPEAVLEKMVERELLTIAVTEESFVANMKLASIIEELAAEMAPEPAYVILRKLRVRVKLLMVSGEVREGVVPSKELFEKITTRLLSLRAEHPNVTTRDIEIARWLRACREYFKAI